jgi:hypothetical protein
LIASFPARELKVLEAYFSKACEIMEKAAHTLSKK